MSTGNTSNGAADLGSIGRQPPVTRHHVIVSLNDEQFAAVEGWRRAHGMIGQPEALGELVRLGLLSEIAKIYRLVSDNRTSGSERARNGGERKAARAEHFGG